MTIDYQSPWAWQTSLGAAASDPAAWPVPRLLRLAGAILLMFALTAWSQPAQDADDPAIAMPFAAETVSDGFELTTTTGRDVMLIASASNVTSGKPETANVSVPGFSQRGMVLMALMVMGVILVVLRRPVQGS